MSGGGGFKAGAVGLAVVMGGACCSGVRLGHPMPVWKAGGASDFGSIRHAGRLKKGSILNS
jgi:hypothetical protein